MGEDDIIRILPGWVSLCAELAQELLTSPVRLIGCDHICYLMGRGLSCGAVHGFKPGEVLKLLGEFCAQSLALSG